MLIDLTNNMNDAHTPSYVTRRRIRFREATTDTSKFIDIKRENHQKERKQSSEGEEQMLQWSGGLLQKYVPSVTSDAVTIRSHWFQRCT